jgi:hypothetical protein
VPLSAIAFRAVDRMIDYRGRTQFISLRLPCSALAQTPQPDETVFSSFGCDRSESSEASASEEVSKVVHSTIAYLTRVNRCGKSFIAPSRTDLL